MSTSQGQNTSIESVARGDDLELHQFSPQCLSDLSTTQLELHYLAEGNANIIYSVSVVSEASLLHHAHCCILRMHKDLSFTRPARQVMTDYALCIRPLFAGREHLLMEQALYQLTPDMVDEANAELREMDQVDLSELTVVNVDKDSGKKIRRSHRRHVYLPSYEDESFAILMPNLQGPGIDWLVEFKPKWLVQSPSAPANAQNCRTCALNAMRRKAGKHQGRGDSGFCPLDLLSEDDELLGKALAKIWPIEEGVELFIREFRQKVQPALRHLVEVQTKNGEVGLEDFRNPSGKTFGIAMAVRDCSVFLALKRVPDSEHGGVEVADVKFADLDLKSTDGGKIEKWAAMEEELLDGGWYMDAGETNCSLNRASRQ